MSTAVLRGLKWSYFQQTSGLKGGCVSGFELLTIADLETSFVRNTILFQGILRREQTVRTAWKKCSSFLFIKAESNLTLNGQLAKQGNDKHKSQVLCHYSSAACTHTGSLVVVYGNVGVSLQLSLQHRQMNVYPASKAFIITYFSLKRLLNFFNAILIFLFYFLPLYYVMSFPKSYPGCCFVSFMHVLRNSWISSGGYVELP